MPWKSLESPIVRFPSHYRRVLGKQQPRCCAHFVGDPWRPMATLATCITAGRSWPDFAAQILTKPTKS